MDIFSIGLFGFIAAYGIYMLVDRLRDIGFALTAVNLHLDAIKKNGANDSERIIALLTEQNTILQRLVEQQRDK